MMHLWGYPVELRIHVEDGVVLDLTDALRPLTNEPGTLGVDLEQVLDIIHEHQMKTAPRRPRPALEIARELVKALERERPQ